jgi:hypothetical protein
MLAIYCRYIMGEVRTLRFLVKLLRESVLMGKVRSAHPTVFS